MLPGVHGGVWLSSELHFYSMRRSIGCGADVWSYMFKVKGFNEGVGIILYRA